MTGWKKHDAYSYEGHTVYSYAPSRLSQGLVEVAPDLGELEITIEAGDGNLHTAFVPRAIIEELFAEHDRRSKP